MTFADDQLSQAPRSSGQRFDAAFTAGYLTTTRRWKGFIFPRETGAFVQVLCPLVSAVLVVAGDPASLLMVLAALAAFLSHEPFMIVSNLRGPRARFENLGRAWRQLVALPLLAVGLAILALILGTDGAWTSLLVPVVAALLLAPFTFGRLEKTAPGEVLASLAMSVLAYPVCRVGGLSSESAWALTGVWAVSFASATFGVRRVTAWARKATTWWRVLAPLIIAIPAFVAAMVLAAQGVVPRITPWALIPVPGFAFYLTFHPPHLRHIRKVGWALAACSMVTMVLLAAGL